MTHVALILITDPQMSLECHAGLPLLKRTVLTAQKGGIEEFIIVAPRNSEERLRTVLSEDTRISSPIHWYRQESGNLPDRLREVSSEYIMIIKAETAFDADVITRMSRQGGDDTAAHIAVRNGPGEAGRYTLKLDGDIVVNCNVPDASHLTAGLILTRPGALKDVIISVPNEHKGLDGIVKGLLSAGTVKAVDVTDEPCMEITSQETLRESENKLLGNLGLATDSPFSTHISRKLSSRMSALLVRFPITPNQVTILSLLVGLVACWLYLQGGYLYSVVGVVVLYASIILDLADGEVARLKFMSSKYGGLLDSLCDSVVFAGIILCAALAIHRDANMQHIVTVGAIAAVVIFSSSNLYFYLHSTKEHQVDDLPSSTMRWVANEDNFFLSLLVFTVLNMLSWYIYLVTVGTSIYLLMLIWELTTTMSSGSEAR